MQTAVDRNGLKVRRLLQDCFTFEGSINSQNKGYMKI